MASRISSGESACRQTHRPPRTAPRPRNSGRARRDDDLHLRYQGSQNTHPFPERTTRQLPIEHDAIRPCILGLRQHMLHVAGFPDQSQVQPRLEQGAVRNAGPDCHQPGGFVSFSSPPRSVCPQPQYGPLPRWSSYPGHMDRFAAHRIGSGPLQPHQGRDRPGPATKFKRDVPSRSPGLGTWLAPAHTRFLWIAVVTAATRFSTPSFERILLM